MSTFTAYLDDQDLIRIQKGEEHILPFYLKTNQGHLALIPVKTSSAATDTGDYFLSPIPLELGEEYTIYDATGNSSILHYRNIVRKPIFDQTFTYTGEDLGSFYTPNQTQFKFWAPISQDVTLHIEDQVYPMHRTENGVWELLLKGDWEGAAYHYEFRVNGLERRIHDPYALSSLANSGDSLVVDRKKITRPITRAARQLDPTEALIYEMSVRDFSVQKEAGFKHPGKFKGLTESPQLNGEVLGFDYLQKLGITHVQLLPVYDFGSVDEEDQWKAYNWGYDPVQYNVPEGSYASDPNDPYARILELQDTIDTYHRANLSVIMDVVYNHVYQADEYAFEQIVPGYFYRYNAEGERTNGTFCGNDVASERSMVRHYIKQSLKQWVSLYGFDGFRFDLMGIHDVKTMQMIRWAMDEVDPKIILYGEGWDMGTGLAPYDKAKKDNAYQLPNIGFFNDDQRNAIKGAEVYGDIKSGFVSGAATEPIVAKAILGSRELGSYLSPNQVVNYVEAHDNYNLHDLLATLHPTEDQASIMKKVETATAMNLLMQGISFMELGQEFGRTKLVPTGENGELTHDDRERAMNSYNAPDAVNQVDWDLINERQESIEFIRQIIELKTKTSAFSYPTYEEVYRHVFVHTAIENSGWIVYEIQGTKEHFLVVFNAKGASFYYENAGNLEMLVTNSRSNQENTLDNVSVAVMNVLS